MDRTAKEIENLAAQGDEEAYTDVFKSRCFKEYVFKLRAKEELWEVTTST